MAGRIDAEKHGWTGTSEYLTWKNMKARCHRPTWPQFHLYGGRGIAVCKRWRSSFKAFLADMGPKPGPGYSIERKKNHLGYSPRNCKWATASEQQRNLRVTRFAVLDGRKTKIADLAYQFGMTPTTLWLRLQRGWDIKRALSTPMLPRGGSH